MTNDIHHDDDQRVEQILSQLQEEIGRHRLALGQLGALEPPDHLAQVRQHKWVNPHLPIGWPVMPKGIIAKLVAYAQKIVRRLLCWYINPIVEQQNQYNEAVFERLHAHETNIGQVAASSHAAEERLTTELKRSIAAQEALEQIVASQREHLLALQQAVVDVQGAQEEHGIALARYGQTMDADRTRQTHDQEVNRFRLQRLENARGAETGAPQPAPSATALQSLDIDYALLGLIHRSEEQLASRLADYDDLVADLPGPVLDLGCGRGDLIAHLGELGVQAQGVDIDVDAVRAGQSLGRDVHVADMFDYIESVADDSLGAVFMIQVAEHLELALLQSLMATIQSKLAPGGLVVVETVNPTCVTALTNAYLLDPSHVYPLHPMMTQFLLQGVGLADVQIRYLHQVEPSQRLQSIDDPQSEAEAAMATNIERLNGILYGPQDYAAIAQKVDDAFTTQEGD